MKKFSAYCFAVICGLLTLLLTVNVAAQSVINTTIYTPPGIANNVGFDFEVAAVHSTGLIYVGATGAYGNDVGVIDPTMNALVTAIPISSTGALDFAVVNQATGLVYFRQRTVGTLAVIDGRPSSATFNQALTPLILTGQQVQSFALDETRSLLYVTNNTMAPAPLQSRVTIIDVNPVSVTFHQVLNEILLPAGALVRGVAVNPVTNKIYVGATGGGGMGGVYVINGASLSISLIAGTSGAFGVVVNENSNLIYSTAPGNLLRAIDGVTDTALAAIPMPGLITPTAFDERLAIHKGTGRVYVQTSEVATSGKVVAVDGNRSSSGFNTVVAAVNIGRQGGEIVVDESLNRIVATSFIDKQTTVIDGATNTVIATIPSTQVPSDMTLDPVTHRAYVANQLNFVQKIDVGSAALAATIVTAAEAAPGVVNPNNHLFYASRTVATTDVQFFNKCGASSTVAGLPHGSGRYLFPVINRNTNRIYFLNTASNLAGDAGSIPGFVSVIDGNSNSIIANIEAGNQPFGMDINETTNKIYVLNANLGVDFPGSITVIDGATNTATSADTSAFPVTARFFGATAVNETTNKFYFQVSNPDSNIGVLDGATNIATPLSASLGPVSVIRVNKILNRVYVGTNTGLLHVLDGATDALITTLTVGSPSAAVGIQRNIAVNETTGQVFVADFNNDTVSVIEGSANTIVATIPVGDGPTSVAVNQLSNRVYVGNTNGKTISFIDGESLAVGSTLSLPLQPAFLAVDADVSRVYTSSGDAPDLSGVTVISDVDGTFDSLRQAIIAATVGDPPGIRNSMLAKVDNAEAAFENGHTQAAINVLHALEHQVEAQRGKRLTHAEADHIRALIAAIINSVWRNS